MLQDTVIFREPTAIGVFVAGVGLGLAGLAKAVHWIFQVMQQVRNDRRNGPQHAVSPEQFTHLVNHITALGQVMNQFQRDIMYEVRREREGLSKELAHVEDAVTRLALELTKDR